MSAAPNFSRSRFTLAVTLATYPLMTALLYGVIAFTPDWPIWLRTMIVEPVISVAMVWVLVPSIRGQLRAWLHP
ncbi:hypothetical protein [Ancylobacter oerskovii]|uniref:DUF2798 domain-containing protein n=1 Tax=Ancylobacter oerskovii TaxID=459519 RepID=A0ABW4YRQ4_9HYPH|nr:hypothetical protein [Ancylobacter oerskovii]MBS7545389.1 hypothetical protein [Ancylobacter oerskovii]